MIALELFYFRPGGVGLKKEARPFARRVDSLRIAPASSLRQERLAGNLGCQLVNLGADISTKKLEGRDCCQSNQRRSNCILRQLKTCLIAKESLNHFVCSFRVG